MVKEGEGRQLEAPSSSAATTIGDGSGCRGQKISEAEQNGRRSRPSTYLKLERSKRSFRLLAVLHNQKEGEGRQLEAPSSSAATTIGDGSGCRGQKISEAEQNGRRSRPSTYLKSERSKRSYRSFAVLHIQKEGGVRQLEAPSSSEPLPSLMVVAAEATSMQKKKKKQPTMSAVHLLGNGTSSGGLLPYRLHNQKEGGSSAIEKGSWECVDEEERSCPVKRSFEKGTWECRWVAEDLGDFR
ncbi:hypothetical protein PGT21_021514 [Puccinia graminis f. sp. tritici]|uniref:Uncharacterized protein n=1 Tax=Puccinia graminis f. sp. tritici TaxID=56615 RepID=A0A5B0P9T1_PUCGR|nr:hypothetical protein PGT21_021514 [Puccinia graminis f. sp. tritici]KAA1117204.1 hypothetical protein PGTUg99_036987 [Puccinia graminis f. sp. tritici]